MPAPLVGSSEEILGSKYYGLKIMGGGDHILLHIRGIYILELLKEETICTHFIKNIFAGVFVKQQLSGFSPLFYTHLFCFFLH